MQSGPSASDSPLKVFIVENHLDTLRSLQRLLEREGYQVATASSMAEALKAIPLSGCDVLLSDIGLPDGTGWELMDKLQPLGPIYAIAMSGFGGSADRTRSKQAGFKHHLLKPCLQELVGILQRQKEAVPPPQ